MKVLVTGAGGWIGSLLLPALRAAELDTVGLTRASEADLLDAPGMADFIGAVRPDAVVHLAGLTHSPDDPAALYRTNVEGTVNLVRALIDRAPRAHVVVTGSAAEYGPVEPGEPIAEDRPRRPVGHYGLSKLLQTELLLRAADWAGGPSVTVLRVFNTVGPGMPRGYLLPDLFDRLRQLRENGGGELEVADLDAVRDFVPVEKVIEAVVRCVRGSVAGIFNVATGRGTRVGEVVDWLREASDFAWSVREGTRGGPRRGVGWSVGSPAALERAVGPIDAPGVREAVLASYRQDVAGVEEGS